MCYLLLEDMNFVVFLHLLFTQHIWMPTETKHGFLLKGVHNPQSRGKVKHVLKKKKITKWVQSTVKGDLSTVEV